MGRIAIPEMLRFGYSPSLATGTVAIMVFAVCCLCYGIFAEQSIARLFVAAIIPGLISLLAYLLHYIWVKLRPSAAPLPNEDNQTGTPTGAAGLLGYTNLVSGCGWRHISGAFHSD